MHARRALATLREHYRELARLAQREARLTASHSIEQAETRHHAKQRAGGKR